jgi:hypothetical protein
MDRDLWGKAGECPGPEVHWETHTHTHRHIQVAIEGRRQDDVIDPGCDRLYRSGCSMKWQ